MNNFNQTEKERPERDLDDQNIQNIQDHEKNNDSLGPENQEPGYLVSFPVDLARDEFVRFNMIVSGINGLLRFRRGQMMFIAVMGAVSLLLLLSELFVSNFVDPVMVLMVLFIASAGGMLIFGASAHVKRAAENAYDQNQMSGQSYFGILSVYPDRIEKRNDQGCVSISLRDAIYIETRDMMVFLSRENPAIVIPARCLTPKDAEAIRRAVLPAVPRTRQRIENSVIPAASAHIGRPDASNGQEWDEENAIRVDVSYSREEFVKMAADTALRTFAKILPYYSVMSLIAALMFGLLYNFGVGIAVYVLINGGLFAFQILGARSRSGRIYDSMPQSGARITVLLTQPGISIRSPGNIGGIRLAWRAVMRAVERPDHVEFFSKSVFLRIPKRCIEDFNEFRAFVDSHFQPAK